MTSLPACFLLEPWHLHVPHQQRACDRCHSDWRPSSVGVGSVLSLFFPLLRLSRSHPPVFLFSYVNHSCAPNCVAEVVTFDKEDKIIIISSRRIPKGEEVRDHREPWSICMHFYSFYVRTQYTASFTDFKSPKLSLWGSWLCYGKAVNLALEMHVIMI